MKRLIILGSGGYGRTVLDIAEQLGYDPIIVLDDAISGYELLTFESYIDSNTEYAVAFGQNEFRLSWCDLISSIPGVTLATLIHPTAYVSPKAKIGEGTVILPYAVVNTGTEVGRGCILNLGCLVDHDCIIEAGAHICLGVIVKGENRISWCEKVEAGEIIQRNTRK